MRGKCLVVTKEWLMRGIDYRLKDLDLSAADGIDLLLAASFSNQRMYQQGLARVGRYTEPCSRYVVRGVLPIDKAKAAQLHKEYSNAKKN